MKRFIFSILAVAVVGLGPVWGMSKAKAEERVISIETAKTQIVLYVHENGEVSFYHYGAKFDKPEQILGYESYRRWDYGTEPPAYPVRGGRHFNQSALAVTYADGALNTELTYVGHKERRVGKGLYRTVVSLEDKKTKLEVDLYYDAYQEEDVIAMHAEIMNKGRKAVDLDAYYSAGIVLDASKYLLTHFHGAWAYEMMVERELLTHGKKSISTMKGVRTTHTENPSFMLSLDTETFDENHGEVLAGALAWSGNYSIDFQVDETNRLSIIAGVNPLAATYQLKPGDTMQTPEMIYTYSLEGAGQASRNLHSWARNQWLYDATKMCPTLLNNWEGTYFKFNEQILKDIIDDVADMGLEMFVLDDGWFGGTDYPRNGSKQGLGDWQIDPVKLPNGVSAIADYAHSKGLKFGIWIEPEMVNPNSHLAQDHPDWIVKEEARDVPTQRTQWLLDLTSPKVQDFVFNVFDSVMQLAEGIDYIKWDCNRHVESVGSAWLDKEQSKFWFDYTQGLYKVLRRVRDKYPDVIIQSCSSGGGRVDYGALHYYNEAWTSDNTESRTRARIQYGTNLIYPAIVTGSHVSAVPNHQTANITPLKFRFDMACSGRLGMELQPADMSAEDKELAATAIQSYKQYRDLVMTGDLYRLASPYESDFYSLMYVDKEKERAVVFAYTLEYQNRSQRPVFKLTGLEDDRYYRITELNVEKSCWWGSGKIFSGSYLKNHGINPNFEKIYSSAVFYVEEVR